MSWKLFVICAAIYNIIRVVKVEYVTEVVRAARFYITDSSEDGIRDDVIPWIISESAYMIALGVALYYNPEGITILYFLNIAVYLSSSAKFIRLMCFSSLLFACCLI